MQSKFLAVGSVVPWAEPQAGAVATQSYANPRYGPDGLALLRQGLSAAEVVKRLTEADDGRDAAPARRRRRAGRRGDVHRLECHDWAGGRTGDGYAAQGNILVSAATVDALAETFEAPRARSPSACSMPRGGQAAGGDSRGQQSAALLVVERDGGYAGLSDVLVDLRVDDHERPIEELRRLYGLHRVLFGKADAARAGSTSTRSSERELASGSAGSDTSGSRTGRAWRTSRNGSTGEGAIDPVVLNELRRKT